MSTDRTSFQDQIAHRREEGARMLLEQGVSCDTVLLNELRRPGSDVRFGANVIARPADELSSEIARVQDRLRSLEPDQYYYPASDLHMTVLELCHGRTHDEAATMARAARDRLLEIAGSLGTCMLDTPTLTFDRAGCAVSLLPRDQNLGLLRTSISSLLSGAGIPVQSRYAPSSAHITFMRFTMPLRSTAHEWVHLLRGTQIDVESTWEVNALWLTHGATWYGRVAGIRQEGPYRLKRV